MFLTNEQTGIYIRLLCAQHQHGGLIGKDAFNHMVGDNNIIRTKFIETEDGFYNERLMNEMIKRAKKSTSLSDNAKIGWEKRKQKQYESNAIASGLQMPIENENEDTVLSIVFKEIPITECVVIALNDAQWVEKTKADRRQLDIFVDYLTGCADMKKTPVDFKKHFFNWKRKDPKELQIGIEGKKIFLRSNSSDR